jgi:chemotaxis protein methyltransferase CheR
MNIIEDSSISPSEYAAFCRLIKQITGIHLSDAKQTLLVGRLGKRLRVLNMDSFGAYFRYLTSGSDADEMQLMVDLMTTNETYFFREDQHFDFLRQHLATLAPVRPVHIWSAAASTGEEVYTLCMVLADELGVDGNWTVTGSDVNQSVLQTAQAGKYDLQRIRGLPPEYLRRYCLKGINSQEGTIIVDPRLRAHTRFLQVNLMDPLPALGPFDIIFLRNVMIYFDQDTKRHVVNQLAHKLQPEGLLIIGHSESLHGVGANLSQVRPTIFRRSA